MHHAFLYISLQSLHDEDVKMPNCKFYGGRKQATTNLFSLSECGPQEINSREIRLHLPFSANSNKGTKDWKTGIHFKTDVFAAVAVVDAKASYYAQGYSLRSLYSFNYACITELVKLLITKCKLNVNIKRLTVDNVIMG